MDPITSSDRLVLLLRQRLQERAKANGAARPKAGAPATASLDPVRALAGVDEVDDHQLRRALIQTILADQFGRGLINAAQFQQVVERVTGTLEQDPAASGLLTQLVADLRQGGHRGA